MTRQTKIKQHMTFILPVVVTLLLSIAVQAQEANENKGEAEIKATLELKLSTVTSAVCMDSRLLLELEVTNISETDVLVSRTRLWKSFSFAYSTDGKHRSAAIGWSTSGPEARFILHPGTSYSSTHEFPLDSEFFQEAGTYTLQTSIDSTHSNRVTFEIYDCGKPQVPKE